MRRRRPRAPRLSHDRWLVSYADFMTLLFAFFVVMFAVSRVDAKKLGTFRAAVQRATSSGVLDHAGSSAVLDGAGADKTPLVQDERAAQLARRGRERERIRKKLAHGLVAAIETGRIALVEGDDGVVLRLREAAFFESASSALREGVLPDLEAVGTTLKGLPNDLRIEGHTDSQPIHGSHFRSNWELSAARAAEVLALFTGRSGLPETQLSVAGYGSQRPLVSNDSEEGRAANRRVDIVVIDVPPAEPDGATSGPIEPKVR